MEGQNTNGSVGARIQSYGEMAVGISFNPGGNEAVNAIKRKAADLIDEIHIQREASNDPEVKAQATLAIRRIQEGQMWGVKAVTWNL